MAAFLAPAGRLLGSAALFVPSHVRWKIVTPYIVLTLLVAAAGTFIATRFVTGSLEERFDNQLAEAARVASDSIVRQEREHLALVRAISFTTGVAEGVAAGDADHIPAPLDHRICRLGRMHSAGRRQRKNDLPHLESPFKGRG